MIGVALAMFFALFTWGSSYYGWDDPEGHVRLALAASFLLGAISGYKGKGS
jgi:hypothetical protein